MSPLKNESRLIAINILGKLDGAGATLSPNNSVSGTITVRDVSVPVEIIVHANWRKVPPRAFCDAPYIRRNIDWHVYSSGELCFVHGKEWEIFFKSRRHGVQHAAHYTVRNISYLLDKHLCAEFYGLDKWDLAWDQYLHDELANPQIKEWEREYRRSNKAHRTP